MKISLITPALAAILGLALISVPVTVQAQATAATPTPAPAASTAKTKTTKAKANTTEYAGKVTAIDATSVTIAGKHALVLTLTATTSYKVNKKAATLADFAVGDKVTGSYTKDAAGALTAHSLHKSTTTAKTKTAKVTAPKPATTAAPAAPATPAVN